MVRGLEYRVLFRDDTDRADFVARLAVLAEAGVLTRATLCVTPRRPPLGSIGQQIATQTGCALAEMPTVFLPIQSWN
jgi:hypothetical protein